MTETQVYDLSMRLEDQVQRDHFTGQRAPSVQTPLCRAPHPRAASSPVMPVYVSGCL